MSYQPQPGTIPFRAITFLEKQGPGAEMAAAVICEDLGIDTNSFSVCMKPAREAGLVRTRKDGRLLIWSLGDGTPDLPARDVEEEEAPVPPPSPEAVASYRAGRSPGLQRSPVGGRRPDRLRRAGKRGWQLHAERSAGRDHQANDRVVPGMSPQPVVIYGVPCTLRNGGGRVEIRRHQSERRGPRAAVQSIRSRGAGRRSAESNP